MKMLKKLAALILAATMVLVLFTACGDGGGTGTREPEKEKEMIATINKEKRGANTLSNDPTLCAVAEKHLDEDLSIESNFFGGMFKGDVHVDGKEKEQLTITVTTRYSYGKVLTALIEFIERGIEKELPDNNQKLNVNSSWVKAGVVVKTTRGDSYMAVAFQINNPNYGK